VPNGATARATTLIVTISQYLIVTSKHRTQVLLEPEQYERLARRARQAGVSVSEWIRRIVDDELAAPAGTRLSSVRGIATGPSLANDEMDEAIYGG